MGFCIYKIWQILKRFAGTFYRVQTLKLGGVLPQKAKIKLFLKFFLHSAGPFRARCSIFQKKFQNKNVDIISFFEAKSVASLNCLFF